MENWKQTLLPAETTVRDAMERLGKSRSHILLVVDEKQRLLGTVTDGDIRRGLLSGMALETSIAQVMNSSPVVAAPESPPSEQLIMLRKFSIMQLPIVDLANRVVALVGIDDLVTIPETLDNPVVIMAGGLGTRLRPMTEDTPKPLLPVGGRPILETIIEQLTGHGLTRIFLSVNYKSEMVRKHFGDGSNFGADIRYLEEEDSLGTAGPLSLIDDVGEAPFLVMNGDLLTKLNFKALLAYHRELESQVTVCVRDFDMQVPFGVIEQANNRVRSIVEKPIHKFLVNAGIYVVEPRVVGGVPKGQRLDMPDLLRQLMDTEEAVAAFPVHEYWLDVGRIEDISRAASEFKSIFD